MARYDLLVKGGMLVLPYVGTVRADLATRDGRIAAIGADLDPADAAEVLDANGQGSSSPARVDAHYHLGIYRSTRARTPTEETRSSPGRRGHHRAVLLPHRAALPQQVPGPTREIFPEILERCGRARLDRLRLSPRADAHRAQVDEIPWLVYEMGVVELQVLHVLQGLQPRRRTAATPRPTRCPRTTTWGTCTRSWRRSRRSNGTAPGRISVSLHCEQAELLRRVHRACQGRPARVGPGRVQRRAAAAHRAVVDRARPACSPTRPGCTDQPAAPLQRADALKTAVGRRRAATRRWTSGRETHCTTSRWPARTLEGKGLGGKVNPPIRDAPTTRRCGPGCATASVDHGGLRSRVLHGGVTRATTCGRPCPASAAPRCSTRC